jgi:hypothetical protein
VYFENTDRSRGLLGESLCTRISHGPQLTQAPEPFSFTGLRERDDPATQREEDEKRTSSRGEMKTRRVFPWLQMGRRVDSASVRANSSIELTVKNTR